MRRVIPTAKISNNKIACLRVMPGQQCGVFSDLIMLNSGSSQEFVGKLGHRKLTYAVK